MSDKYCCITWQELSIELSVAKETELNSLMTDKGLPRSVFASTLKVLGKMTDYCPVCGSALNPELQTKLKEQHRVAIAKINTEVEALPSPVEKKRCGACGGRGILGTDNNGVKINCMRCHGQGTFESKHIAEDSKAKFARSKVDEVREVKGMGEGAVNIDAKGDTNAG